MTLTQQQAPQRTGSKSCLAGDGVGVRRGGGGGFS